MTPIYIQMKFILCFVDNFAAEALKGRVSKEFYQKLEDLEHTMRTIRSEEDLLKAKQFLSDIISEISALKITKNRMLHFLGGLTLIERNMEWKDGKARNIDIHDDMTLRD